MRASGPLLTLRRLLQCTRRRGERGRLRRGGTVRMHERCGRRATCVAGNRLETASNGSERVGDCGFGDGGRADATMLLFRCW